MKKVININYHSRVIPIEEPAYEILRQYSESLRKYFANEEGREEIINDIESRIAELFSERLKKGANCITDLDVNDVIASMGRPEDFEAADADHSMNSASSSSKQESGGSQSGPQQDYQKTYIPNASRGRLYRNADDKILGGVCSGLANYLGIDPVIMRIVFVLLIGALLWVYILLWIIVPSQSLHSNITKRLFRSSDDRVIGGVAGGLAAYLNIQVWIPRLIFALPFILGVFSGIIHTVFLDWHWGFGFAPRFISGGLGSTLVLTYIILWIAVPVATTASEKLEMRGERVDLNSIANTIKEDLEGFKGKAEKMGSELKDSAQKWGENIKNDVEERRRAYAAEVLEKRNQNSGFGHIIGVLFKAFFLFIAGVIAISLFGVLIALLFGGMAALPLKNFFFSGYRQDMLAWGTLVLFMGVPLIALITWLIRRIMGVRSRNHYLGYVFASLWIIGLICMITLFSSFVRNFRSRDYIEEDVKINQPATGKLLVDVDRGISGRHYLSHGWNGLNLEEDWPVFGDNYDSLVLNTVRINIVKSKDSLFHVLRLKFSHGYTQNQAQALARKIKFEVTQQDSTLYLPGGFNISKNDKFRNQQLLMIIEVPQGKKIELKNRVNHYNWFTINMNRHSGWNIRDYDESYDNFDNWGDNYGWDADVEYIMTNNGLERTHPLKKDMDDEDQPDTQRITPKQEPGYRYHGKSDTLKPKIKKETLNKKDSASKSSAPLAEIHTTENIIDGADSTPVYLLSTLFQ